MKPKLSEEAVLEWTKNPKIDGEKSTYQVKFVVDSTFGMPGAITVSNRYDEEFYLDSINIQGVVHFACNSWVSQDEKFNAAKRIFFSTKVLVVVTCITREIINGVSFDRFEYICRHTYPMRHQQG